MSSIDGLSIHAERKDISWAACDAIATQGKKPTMSLVRAWTGERGITKGSDGDVQRDINVWFSTLLELRDKGVLGLPEPIANMARELWIAASALADERLAQEKSTLVALEAELRNTVAEAETQEQATAHELELALQDSIHAKQIIATMQADQIKSEAQHESKYSEYRVTILAKDERINSLESELTRVSTEHARNEEILESTRKHTLMQIDQARVEMMDWKDKSKRAEAENVTNVESYRQKASSLSSAVSNLTGRNEAMAESLSQLQIREKELLREIEQLKSDPKPVLTTESRAGRFKARRVATSPKSLSRKKL